MYTVAEKRCYFFTLTLYFLTASFEFSLYPLDSVVSIIMCLSTKLFVFICLVPAVYSQCKNSCLVSLLENAQPFISLNIAFSQILLILFFWNVYLIYTEVSLPAYF